MASAPDPATELVAVYDAAGAVIGAAPRGEVYARSLWHGVGGVLLRSGDGARVYVHRRTLNRDGWVYKAGGLKSEQVRMIIRKRAAAMRRQQDGLKLVKEEAEE